MKINAYIPSKLKGIVDLIWEHEIDAPGRYTILPSGKVELIFPIYPIASLDAVKIEPNKNPVNNHSCFLSGLHSKPLKMTFNKFHAFGIQMKPVAVKALFDMPLYSINDYFVDGNEILNTIGVMEDKLHHKGSFAKRAQWFEKFMLKKINETADLHVAIKLDHTVKKYISQKRHGSHQSVEHLFGYSRTQTYRIFNEWFGISAHSYQKLMQFIQSVETLHNRNIKLFDVGLECSYYDQSHFIRNFKEFADMTPRAYRNRMAFLPGQILG